MNLFFLLLACQESKSSDDGGLDTSTSEELDTATETEVDATSDPPPFEEMQGSISGTVDIVLYTEGEDGEQENISWDEAYAGIFPFGKIFIAAYYEDPDTGEYIYLSYDIVENPQPSGNAYQIDISLYEAQDIRIFGVLDYYVDNITGTDEPIGGYNRAIPFEEGMQQSGVDFTILSPLHKNRPPCERNTIEVTGEANITETYTGGEIAVVLMQAGNRGPIHHSIVQPEILGGGASAEYIVAPCADSGYMALKGIWDYNLNGMFDPFDRSGPYISEPNLSGNPINVSFTNLSNHEIQIPLGDSSGLKLVPFVNLLGTIKPASGTFDDLTTGGTLYVTALQYRPNRELTIAELEENSYDVEVFPFSELTGQTSIEWKLTVPSETIAYLWAYIDKEGNGIVNEPQEPLASGGEDDNGKYPTGSSSTSNIDMILAIME
jgi:hypothetical protein